MWPLSRKRTSKGLSKTPSHLELETRGKKFLEKVATSSHQEPMGVTLMMLAWTAGPVTLLTAWSATWIGYGHPMNLERTLYIVVYSVIAGLMGLLTRVIYDITQGRKQSQDKSRLLDIVDRLPEIIYMVRDLRLANQGPDTRRIESAGILLRKFDLGPEWVAGAIEDLTGDQNLARSAERIEQFRRAGLYNRMQDIVNEVAESTDRSVAELRQTHPRIATVMASRLAGRAPDIRDGQPRERLFLERILAAIEQENEELITLPDVEHMMALCFELMCGREISYLKVEYTGGDWNLSKAMDRLEQCRNDHRVARARVYSRLRALTAYIDYVFPNRDITAAPGLSVRILLEAAIDGINALAQEVNDARRQLNQSGQNLPSLQMRLSQLEKTLILYEEVQAAHLQQGRTSRRFNRALKVWQHRSRKWQSDSRSALKRGLRISEQTIALDDEEKISVAHSLGAWLKETRLRHYSGHSSEHDKNEKMLTNSRARELAIETVLILDPHIHLHSPEIQRAIDNTPLSTMAPLEPGMSPMTKAALGQAMANAVSVNLGEMAEKLAQNLIRYYRVPLSEATIHFLVETYNANRSRLEFIARNEQPQTPGNTQTNPTITIPDIPRYWQSTLYNARRTVNQFS
ncbi:hypothetical protein [Sansalvadorimonas verongulae]|uniref:hypothetical protein n=1 Tax=Sansalvadorimonas verongulae TaxID=2172824 RepID=UPI0012BBDFAE|nr:hypothetical protein [Sansalvadorimonas verongulae]MTI15194.1 hypothetical protein [Sansalvadorimonas verongulae]